MDERFSDPLLREIDEDLRRERYAKIWKRYGTSIIAGAVAVVIGVAAYEGWQTYDRSQREAAGDTFASALRQLETDPSGAADQLRSLKEAPAGYPALAAFQTAALLEKSGDRQGAVDIYDGMAKETSDPLWRDAAIIKGSLVRLNGQIDPVDVLTLERTVEPLTADTNPWRYSAREIMAVLAIETGDRTKARELLTALTSDSRAPAGVVDRSRELLQSLDQPVGGTK